MTSAFNQKLYFCWPANFMNCEILTIGLSKELIIFLCRSVSRFRRLVLISRYI